MRQNQSIGFLQRIFPILIALMGLGLLFLAFAANLVGLGSGGGFGTNQLFLAVSGMIVSLSGIILILSNPQRQYVEWLLLATGAAAVAIAADLFVIGTLMVPTFKYLLIMVVLFGFILLNIASMPQAKENLWKALLAYAKIDTQTALRFLGLLLQLGLIILVIREFKLENQAFYINVLQVTFYGFLLHFFLPPTHRLPFFLFISIAALVGVLGLANGGWIIGTGLLLLLIIHLPLAFRWRMVILGVLAAFLAYSRAGFLPTLPKLVWPIFGSIFMFRLIIYIYDLKHAKKPFNFWSSLSYFFLLPNVVFPFFPLVDYTTFTRTYYNEDQHKIYQTGVNWMYRGMVQLILYRAIYYYFAISHTEVDTAFDLVWFAYSSFLLYLQVSGQFHLIIGLLHLFGFNLPQTNDKYFLSSNFNDLWRRVNIYWKDFMQKIFYYPSYTWLTKRGITGNQALVLTTIYVFIATWFFHAYQWFWLRGAFLFTVTDVTFWVILALLVIINTLRETKQGRVRTLGTKIPTNQEIVRVGINNLLTMSFLTFLWTMWTSPNLKDWLALWAQGLKPLNLLILVGCYAVLGLGFIGLNWYYKKFLPSRPTSKQTAHPLQLALTNSAFILGIFILGNPLFYNRVGGQVKTLFADLTTARLSDSDANLLLRGYYEDLIGVNRFNSELWDVYSKRPADWPTLQDTPAAQLTNDFRLIELNPSVSLSFHGEQFTTNSWGMRDKEYNLEPDPGTYRIALVGPSFIMGSGAADREVFEWVLEDQLNEEYGGKKYAKYEILNFAVAGHSALQELYVFENTALQFKPNALFYFGHQLEQTIIVRNLANRIKNGSEIPYPYITEVIAKANIDPTKQTQDEIDAALQPYGAELVDWTYHYLADLCREKGILPVWIYMPTLEISNSVGDQATFTAMAKDAGWILLDLSDIYQGQDIKSITVAEWDLHPNGAGHRLIAQHLYQALLANDETAKALGLK
ncbi:MAG TPA: hypothetical protein PK530_04045 [Anaerolineales bacterium]|nr:hypothetical protein [Anaerolineales bacterium]